MRPIVKPAYTLLGKYYDRLMASHPKMWRGARQHILARILPRVRSVCELACGSGTTALEFARRGLRVYAVDASPVMCRHTRQKARQAGLRVRVLRADMRSFHLPQPVDLVTCEFDAINHMPRKADLARVARAVARALCPGGYFFFDANTRQAFEKIWPNTWWVETREFALVMHGGYDAQRRTGWTDAEWFLPVGRNRWRRYRERYEQVCWSDAEIGRTLRRAGFTRLRAWDAARFLSTPPWNQRGCRSFYLAQKSRDSRRKA